MVMAVMLLWVISGIMGCGKKGPPLPPLALMPPAPTNITYRLTVDQDQVMLQWTLDPEFPKKNRGPNMGIEIYRATRVLTEDACRDCPLTFEQIAELPITTLEYEAPLERGYRYFYRLRFRRGTDIFSDYSETVSFDFK